jgi:5-methylcytosine-specific restriction endonuclease McrA
LARNIKYTLEEVSDYFRDNGCELLETSYSNNRTKLRYKCICGDVSDITFSKFKSGQRCSSCKREKIRSALKSDFNVVIDDFKKAGLIVVDDVYSNNHTPISFLCVNGHKGKMTHSSVKRGGGCNQCSYEKIADNCRHDYTYIKEYFESNDCLLLTNEYSNSEQKLKFMCSCGEVSEKSFEKFKRRSNCKNCSYKNSQKALSFDFSYVNKFFEDSGCTLLESEYINNRTSMRYICSCGKEATTRFADFKSGKRCYSCGIEKITGENNANWNPNRPQIDRELRRQFPIYQQWRKSVFERDRYTCVSCGTKGTYLNAHHLNGYHWCEEGRFDVDNGVTLCRFCHNIQYEGSFHNVYGNKYNTLEQFNEWIQNKRKKDAI